MDSGPHSFSYTLIFPNCIFIYGKVGMGTDYYNLEEEKHS